MKIKNIEIKNNLILAPMAGVTDFAFRSLARTFGAGLSYTEMISAKGLLYNYNKDIYKQMLYTEENESPKAVQIFGSNPEIMAKVCKLECLQKFDIIDINMGCPAPKIIKNGEGSALLKNIELAVKVAKACVEASNKAITVKMRTGFSENEIVAVELAKKLESVGVSAITIHGRTREQMYSGNVDYSIIKKVKQAVSIPVIANGDIRDLSTLEQMQQTGADAFMVGRASMGSPWLFAELLGQKISQQQKFETILKHLELLKKIYSEKYITSYFRKHLLWYVKNINGANKYRVQLAHIGTIDEAIKILKEIFKIS